MKLIKYIDDGNRALVAILFDDNTYAETTVISQNRDKQDILKDAYIISKNKEKLIFEGNKDEYEDLVLEAPKPNTLDVNFYELSGKVYDQYGNEIQAEITFSVEGTDKAKIEKNELIEEEVTEITSFFIVAKCGDVEKKEERFIYPKVEPKEPPKKEPTEVEKLEAKVNVLEEQGAFRDDLIQEMATIVYGSLEAMPKE
ncbi:hypothetical protein QP531_06360 [Peptoniphilus harei]|uniref:hypothetical protein n=1 Tax=Peptoniphilus harei TaxID=54005 RepID=UPI00254FC204|nr:hypothetical protein [Peptoniphilus harei]MDK7377438.1 hypothetical protein [Peptoniphilus harei]MDK7679751.1 hypothetical protein [Peptoniphilus harei]